MKLLWAALLVVVTHFPGFSQEVSRIDTIRNFRGFTFGDAPEQYGKDLRLDLIISYGLKYYKYEGRQPKEVYGNKIVDFNLGFRDDLLEYIDFYFNKLNQEDFDMLYGKLTEEFGLGKLLTETNELGVVQAVEWKGDKTWIQLYRYDESANDTEDRRKTVLMLTDIQ